MHTLVSVDSVLISARITVAEALSAYPGNTVLKTAYGFFTRNVRMLDLLFNCTLTQNYFQRELLTIPMPYNLLNSDPSRRLRIGYYVDDGLITPVPRFVALLKALLGGNPSSVRRTVSDCVERLRYSTTHELVPFEVPDIRQAARLFYHCLLPEGGQYLLDITAAEPSDVVVSQMLMRIKVTS